MGTLGNLRLPAQMSPCLRLFIDSLFDDVSVKRGALLYQNHHDFVLLSAIRETPAEKAALSRASEGIRAALKAIDERRASLKP